MHVTIYWLLTLQEFQVVKDNCNPVFDESYEYTLSQGELNNKLLEVTVCTQKQLFYSSSNVLGQVCVVFKLCWVYLNLNSVYRWLLIWAESIYYSHITLGLTCCLKLIITSECSLNLFIIGQLLLWIYTLNFIYFLYWIFMLHCNKDRGMNR